MSNLVTVKSAKDFFSQDMAKKKMEELLGKRASAFTTSVLQIVNSNDYLAKADPATVFNAACMAATLDLPINNSLGFAYIVPYNNKKAGKQEAQFQLGYKGFIQLAQRSGQFKRIKACAIHADDTEQTVLDRLTCLMPKQPSGKITGYIAYFELLNGYVANLSMTIEELNDHAKKYSQSYKSGFGVWKDNFEAMCEKTVLKLLLSKQAPLSIDMQTAMQADQSVIKDVESGTFEHVDNQPEKPTALLDVSNDENGFASLKSNIEVGAIDKTSVLSGESGYVISTQQREIIARL